MRDEERPRGVAGPVIVDLLHKLGTLERRRSHLRARLNGDHKNATSRSYDEAEAHALDAAIEALRYHRREMEGELQASVVLAELVEVVGDIVAIPAKEGVSLVKSMDRLERAMAQATKVLAELDQ